jgi:hypothetical protein
MESQILYPEDLQFSPMRASLNKLNADTQKVFYFTETFKIFFKNIYDLCARNIKKKKKK